MPSGGYRIGAGRPRKSDLEKELLGRPIKIHNPVPKITAPKIPDTENLMTEYFAAALKECALEVPSVAALRGEIMEYISAMGCVGLVPPQIISDYVINRQGFLACECTNRKIGRMTKDFKLSPYVTAAQGYNKAMRDDFNLILQIVHRHSGERGDEKNEFLELLKNRGF
ncbi:hypothetical protein FACS1894219_04670 [Clostridia bacterium]|nr:hypothetical protein FACS1894219_04670 [Clostridia bacterium]